MIPIDDATTVAYVGVVHALSELRNIDFQMNSRGFIEEEVSEACTDLQNALDMLKPHVRKADPPKSETMQEYMIRMGW